MSNTWDAISQQWSEDVKIDITRLSDEIMKTPQLHSKYLDLLMEAKMKHRKAEMAYYEMKGVRSSYYKGEMTREQLQHYGWPQYQGIKPIKSSMGELLETDTVLMDLDSKRKYWMFIMEGLESIMKSIHSRTFDVRALVDYQKFVSGS